MAVALETIVKQLTDSGIIAPGKLDDFVPPKATPKDGEELLRQLLKQNLLTKFQAQQYAQGRGKALILGNYIILDKIGEGGMGRVFKAEHRRMKRVVAIKMLPKATMNDAAAAARFQREVEAAAKLRHRNIVGADDADEANGVHFLVMEYVEGADLSALVKKSGPLPVAKAVNYILQAARGLEFAHAKGVIHRDIKPANLLLDTTGTVKILDMGLARLASSGGDAETQAELTGTGAVMGTVDYMAPEQALNTKRADARSDIYSLGCTLYYLIAGKQIYQGESMMERLVAHREKSIPPLQPAQGIVPKAVEAVFRKMVAKDPAERYQTMSEVVAAIQSCGKQPTLRTAQALPDTGGAAETNTSVADESAPTVTEPSATRKGARGNTKQGNKTLIYGSAGVGLLGLLALAGVFFMTGPKSGKDVAAEAASATSGQPAQELSKTDPPAAIATKSDSVGSEKETAAPAEVGTPAGIVDAPTMLAAKQATAVAEKLPQLNPADDAKLPAENKIASAAIETGVAKVAPDVPATEAMPQPVPVATKPKPSQSADPAVPAAAEPVSGTARGAPLPRPTPAKRQTAQEKLAAAHHDQLAEATDHAHRIKLAKEFLRLAEAAAAADGRFAYYEAALQLASEDGDLSLALSVIAQWSASFDIDQHATAAKAVDDVIGGAKTPAQRKELAMALVPVMDEQMAADRYDLADLILTAELPLVAKTRDLAVSKEYKLRETEMKEWLKLWSAARDARAKLAEDPGDAAAHLALGRYLCLARADWPQGLSHLRSGSDDPLRAAAKMELAAPINADAQAEVGEAWWNIGEKDKERAAAFPKLIWQDHALTWIRKSLPKVAVPTRNRLKSRVSQYAQQRKTAGTLFTRRRPLDVEDTFGGHWYKFYRVVISWAEAKSRCEAMGGHLAIVETSEENEFTKSLIVQGTPGDGDFRTWLGARADEAGGQLQWLDGSRITFADWQPGHTGEEADPFLAYWNGGPSSVKMKWFRQPERMRGYFVCEWDQ